MKKKVLHILILICILGNGLGNAQNPVVDSLQKVLSKTNDQNLKIKVLHELFLEHEYTDEEKAKFSLDEALKIAEAANSKIGKASTYILYGYFAEDKSELTEALKHYSKALKIYQELNDEKGESSAQSNIASIYSQLGNYPEALKYLLSCLKLDERSGDKINIASTYSHIAIIYSEQKNWEEAIKNHMKSLDFSTEAKDQVGMAYAYNNIGNVYQSIGKYDAAMENLVRSLEIKKEMGDERGMASSYNNIASAYLSMSLNDQVPSSASSYLDKAFENAMLALKIREALDDRSGIASVYNKLGVILFRKENFKEAEAYLKKSNAISLEIGLKEYIRENYSALAELDSAIGNYKGAYENHKLFVLYRDSLDNEQTRKKTIQVQMTFDFEKKEAVAQAEHKKELENQGLIAEEKSRKQKVVLGLVSGFLLIVILFAGIIFRSLRITKKQKEIIEVQKSEVEEQKLQVEHQKTLVEEHQKEIIDSIYYARRIQRSLLPTEKYIERNLKRLMTPTKK